MAKKLRYFNSTGSATSLETELALLGMHASSQFRGERGVYSGHATDREFAK